MSVPHKMPPISRKYKISKKGSLIIAGRLYQPGHEVDGSQFKSHMLKDHLSTGLLVPSGKNVEDEEPDAEAIKHSAPAIPSGIAPTIDGGSKADSILSDVTKTAGNADPVKSPGVASDTGVTQGITPKAEDNMPKHTPMWTLPPHKLQPKGLEELNAMILERDAAVAPFSTKEEAIAWLSQDYVK